MSPIETEMTAAQVARAAGNEGRARVCARRAVGHAARAFYARTGVAQPGDALAQLKHLRDDARLPEALRAAAGRLTVKVDHDHHLPFADDPLADARTLIQFLTAP